MQWPEGYSARYAEKYNFCLLLEYITTLNKTKEGDVGILVDRQWFVLSGLRTVNSYQNSSLVLLQSGKVP
jgi:hypothetical protein